MKIQSLAYCASGVLIALALAGCHSDGNRTASIGGPGVDDPGGDGPGGDGPGDGTIYSKQADGTTLSAADIYNQDSKFSADNQTAKLVVADYDKGTVSASEPATFSFTTNENSSIDASVNGDTQNFTQAQTAVDDPYSVAKSGDGGSYYGVFSNFQTLDELDDTDKEGAGKTKYATVWGYNFTGAEAGQSLNGYAAVGTETRPADVKALAKASYDGQLFAEAYDAKVDDPQLTGSRAQVTGSVHLDADFDGGTISGSVADLRTRFRVPGDGNNKPAFEARAGTINMESADITGNGYSGALSADADAKASLDINDIQGSSYSGRFYGPAADETAGVVGLHVNNTDGTTNVGAGGFSATKSPAR